MLQVGRIPGDLDLGISFRYGPAQCGCVRRAEYCGMVPAENVLNHRLTDLVETWQKTKRKKQLFA